MRCCRSGALPFLARRARAHCTTAHGDDLGPIIHSLQRWKRQASTLEHIVADDDQDVGVRHLRVAGRAFPALGSLSQAKRAFKRGDILLNGEQVEDTRRIKAGDKLTLQLAATPEPSTSKLQSAARFVTRLRSQGLCTQYEDDVCAVVFKPAGVHTKSGERSVRGRRHRSLEEALPAELLPSRECVADALAKPLVMHRLDVPVSGLCVVAKTLAAARQLGRAFQQRTVHKTYHALLLGEIDGMTTSSGTRIVDAPVGAQQNFEEDLQGEQSAVTEVRLLRVTPHARWGPISTVALRPLTGRRHQLRIHAARVLGTPIMGDDLYWDDAAAARGAPLPPVWRGRGLYLQSCRVAFAHPIDGHHLEVSVPEADKFEALREGRGVTVRERVCRVR